MKKKRQLKRRALHQMLNPENASVEEVAKVLLFGNRSFQVADELWEDLIIGHMTEWRYN